MIGNLKIKKIDYHHIISRGKEPTARKQTLHKVVKILLRKCQFRLKKQKKLDIG